MDSTKFPAQSKISDSHKMTAKIPYILRKNQGWRHLTNSSKMFGC